MKKVKFIIFLLWSFLGALVQPLLAQDHEGFAYQAIKKNLENLSTHLSSVNDPGDQDFRDLNNLFFDTKERISRLEEIRFQGMQFNSDFLSYLKTDYFPRLETIFNKWGKQPDKSLFENQVQEAKQTLTELDNQLRQTARDIFERAPLAKRYMQFMALARSETLGDGTIGDWNPVNPDAIQGSAIYGITNVLDKVDKFDFFNQKITLDLLADYHRELLGASAHFFSQGGRINDIYFTEGNNKKTHIMDYLRAWEGRINGAFPGLESSWRAYEEFLHLHPFGDVNGRIAEIIRIMLLEKASLPAMLTREKTCAENYFFSPKFGEGSAYNEMVALAKETLAFLTTLGQEISEGFVMTDVRLVGPNVVATLKKGPQTKLMVSNRSYFVKEGDPLPPIKGSPVVVNKPVEELSMRYSLDGWKTYEDIVPQKKTVTERLGTTKMIYPFYFVDVKEPKENLAMSFVFYYQHPNGSTVWFNNHGKNFNILTNALASASFGPCGVLSQEFREQFAN